MRAPKLDVIESSSSIQDLASIEARKVAPPKTSKSASERASGEKVEPPGEQSQPHPANSSARPHLRSALGAVGRRARAAYRVDERREARQIKWTGNRNIGSIWAGNKRSKERRADRSGANSTGPPRARQLLRALFKVQAQLWPPNQVPSARTNRAVEAERDLALARN